MKQINLLLVSVLLLMSGIFVSCEKTEDSSASLDFISDGGTYIDENTTVEPGAALKFKFSANSETDMEFMEIIIETSSSISQRKWSTDIANDKKNSYDGTATLTAPNEEGTYTYYFIVYDADPDEDEDAVELINKSIVITVATSINTFNSKLLYDSNGTSSKTFFSSQDGGTYTITEAVANKAKIDFGFLYDQAYNTTKACLISLDEYSKTGNYAAQLTGTLNATTFKTVASVNTYNNAVNADSILNAYNKATAAGAVTGYTTGKIAAVLAEGNILAFKTNSGKYGIIKVGTVTRNSEDANNGQTIDISVKVQK